MNKNNLKIALENVKAKDSLKQKIVRDSNATKSTPRINFRKPVIVAVVCLILIMTATGMPYLSKDPDIGDIQVGYLNLLSVKVYATSEGDGSTTDGVELQQGTKILLGGYSAFMSSVPGYPFEFSYPDAKIEVTVNNGELCLWGNETDSKVIGKGKSYTINNSGKIYWSPLSKDGVINDTTTIEFRIIEKENIIGVGFIEIVKKENSTFYSAELLGIKEFPKNNDQYQKVSEEKITDFKATLFN